MVTRASGAMLDNNVISTLSGLTSSSVSGMSVDHKKTIENNSREITRLRDRAVQAGADRDVSPEHRDKWQSAWDEFNDRYDALAFPGGVSTARQRLRAGDADAIEYALCFIEVRPFFFRFQHTANANLRTQTLNQQSNSRQILTD